jgi:hypothetical protein
MIRTWSMFTFARNATKYGIQNNNKLKHNKVLRLYISLYTHCIYAFYCIVLYRCQTVQQFQFHPMN